MKKRIYALLAGSLLSVAGLSYIRSDEGLRLTAYPDPGTRGAPWTICYGHTGPEVHPGLTVTKSQCEVWLKKDTEFAEAVVQTVVTVPLKQGEYDAYTGFVFNAGPRNFESSTMLRLLNAGDRAGACNQFPRWVYADGRRLEGLAVRRTRDQTICHYLGDYVYVPHH